MSETRAPDLPGDLYGSIVAVVVASAEGDDRNRPTLILELAEGIAAAIAAARAEGVALGAANMRERCAGVVQSQGHEVLAEGMRRVGDREFPELADADAILRAERVKGAEAMRGKCYDVCNDVLNVIHRYDTPGEALVDVMANIDALEVQP